MSGKRPLILHELAHRLSAQKHGRDVNPERVPLVARLSKRCRACEHNVVKPEAKAQSVKFMMNLSA